MKSAAIFLSAVSKYGETSIAEITVCAAWRIADQSPTAMRTSSNTWVTALEISSSSVGFVSRSISTHIQDSTVAPAGKTPSPAKSVESTSTKRPFLSRCTKNRGCIIKCTPRCCKFKIAATESTRNGLSSVTSCTIVWFEFQPFVSADGAKVLTFALPISRSLPKSK